MIIGKVSAITSNSVKDYFESEYIKWIYNNSTIHKNSLTADGIDCPQFVFTIVDIERNINILPACVIDLWRQLVKDNPKIFENFISLSRVKANMVTRGTTSLPHIKHIDQYNPHMVLIYYVNNCDGDTYIYDNDTYTSISPEQGKYVIFDGALMHAGSSPVHSNHRIVINFNF
jgi:hypothetical protein